MPNWCANYLTITGERVKEVVDIINTLKPDEGVFSKVIGIEPEDCSETWGTKWDIERSDIIEDDTNIEYLQDMPIEVSFHTAWSPPIGFCKKLHEKFGVHLTMYYGESGSDFYGRYTIDGEGTKVEEFKFMEGLYILDNDTFWHIIEDNLELYVSEYEEEFDMRKFKNRYTNFAAFDSLDEVILNELHRKILTGEEG